MRPISIFGAMTLLGACAHARGAASSAPTDSPESVLASVASGERTLASLVDPRRGLLQLRAAAAGDDESAPESEATHLCGPSIDGVAEELTAHLRETRSLGDAPVRCEGLVCVDPPHMEWDPERTYRFVASASGVQLVSVTLVDVFVPEDVVAEHRTWALREAERLSRRRCP